MCKILKLQTAAPPSIPTKQLLILLVICSLGVWVCVFFHKFISFFTLIFSLFSHLETVIKTLSTVRYSEWQERNHCLSVEQKKRKKYYYVFLKVKKEKKTIHSKEKTLSKQKQIKEKKIWRKGDLMQFIQSMYVMIMASVHEIHIKCCVVTVAAAEKAPTTLQLHHKC